MDQILSSGSLELWLNLQVVIQLGLISVRKYKWKLGDGHLLPHSGRSRVLILLQMMNTLFILCLAASGLSCSTRDLRYSMQDLLLWCVDSLVEARGLSSPVAHGILVSQPEIEPASPVLQGRFLTTGPLKKSLILRSLHPFFPPLSHSVNLSSCFLPFSFPVTFWFPCKIYM